MTRAPESSHALTSITKIPFKPSTANETANNSMLVMMARFDRARASGFFVLVSRMVIPCASFVFSVGVLRATPLVYLGGSHFENCRIK